MLKYITIIIALAAGLISCSKGDTTIPLDNPSAKTSLSFFFKNYAGAATYAATVPASDREKTVHDMDIFVFSTDGLLARQMIKGTDYTESISAGVTTLNISKNFIETNVGKKVVFYFVGNNSASKNGKHIASFSGTQADFEELLTNPLGNPAGKAELIELAAASDGLLMTAKSDEITLIGKQEINLELKRRTARFDVKNPKPTEFLITKIYVSNAKTQAQMFGSASGLQSIPTSDLEPIAGPSAADFGTDNVARSVFYLYPTDMATTEISMEVQKVSDNSKKLFKVNSNEPILANKRYLLIFNETTLTLWLADYEDGDL